MARSTTYTLLLLCRVAVPAMLACVAWWLKQIHTYLQILTQSSFLSWQMHATRSKAFAIHTKKALTNIIYCLAKSGSVGAMVISKNANQIVFDTRTRTAKFLFVCHISLNRILYKLTSHLNRVFLKKTSVETS